MIRWLVNHPTTVFVVALAVLIFGMISYVTLPRESSPDITIPIVLVTTPYIGVSPQDVEKLVTIPVFDASSLEVGSSVMVGGALSRRPASSSRMNGDQIIMAARPAKYSSRDCFHHRSPGGEDLARDL